MKHWINIHYKSLIIGAFLIPIITVAIVSISHVTKWYGISNPLSWAIYLSIGIEIAALSALAAISADMGKKVYFPFLIVTLVQFIGNIFFAYSYIDINSIPFKDWVDLVSPLVSFMGVEEGDLVGHKRFLALFAGGMLPIISLSFLHMLVKFTEEDRKKEITNEIKEEKDVIPANHLMSEVSKIRLSDEDFKKLEEVLLNPPKPNENLKESAKKYQDNITEKNIEMPFSTWDDQPPVIEEEKHSIFPENMEYDDEYSKPVYTFPTTPTQEERKEILVEMMQKDEELGLYDPPPYTIPIVKEPVVSDDFTIGPEGAFEMTEEIHEQLKQETITPALSDEEVREMFMDEWERKFELVKEEDFSTIEPTEEEIEQNFSTIEPNSENIFQDNIEDYPNQFQEWEQETVPEPFATNEETTQIDEINEPSPNNEEDEKKK